LDFRRTVAGGFALVLSEYLVSMQQDSFDSISLANRQTGEMQFAINENRGFNPRDIHAFYLYHWRLAKILNQPSNPD